MTAPTTSAAKLFFRSRIARGTASRARRTRAASRATPLGLPTSRRPAIAHPGGTYLALPHHNRRTDSLEYSSQAEETYDDASAVRQCVRQILGSGSLRPTPCQSRKTPCHRWRLRSPGSNAAIDTDIPLAPGSSHPPISPRDRTRLAGTVHPAKISHASCAFALGVRSPE